MEAFINTFGIIGGLFVFCFFLFLAILWIILPFAVFGIKSRLDKTNKLLENISNNTGYTLHEIKKLTMGQRG